MANDENLINALKNADSNGIGLMAMKTQCSHYWYREYVPEGKQEYYKGSILHTSVLKWALRNDFITSAIPGYTNFQQMEEDFSVAYDLEYTEEEKIYDVILTTYNFRQPHREEVRKAIAYAAKAGLGVVGIKVLAGAYWDKERKHPINAKTTLQQKQRENITCRGCSTCAVSCTMGFDVSNKIQDVIRVLDVPNEFLV